MRKTAGLIAALVAPVLFVGVFFSGIAYAEDISDASKDNSAEVTKERKPRIRPRAKKKVYSADIPGVKITLVDINHEMFLTLGVISVVNDKHLAEGEKFRVRITGSGGLAIPPNVPSDWTPYDTMMFSVFVEGNDDWKGSLDLIDNTSMLQSQKNNRNKTGIKAAAVAQASVPFSLKKGENKDFKIKLPPGLLTTDKSRKFEWNKVVSFSLSGANKKAQIYINNIYLINEKASVPPAGK